MNKKGEAGIGYLLLVAIGVILGLAFLTQIASDSNTMTATQSYTEQVNVSSAFTDANNINDSKLFYVTKAYIDTDSYKTEFGSECYITPTVVNVTGTSYTDPTDVVREVSGYFNLENTSKVLAGGQILNLTYTYCEDGYNKDSSSRTIIGLIVLFSTLIIFSIAIPDIRDLFK